MASSKLFQPIKVGTSPLQHRVVLAPLTRLRVSPKEHVPLLPLVDTYYSQRASRPGGLLISEATLIAPQAGGDDNLPGIWSESQIKAWKQITDTVHAKGSYIFLQLWALGRAGVPAILKEDGYEHVAPSAIPIDEKSGTPRELTIPEIQGYVELYAQAARNSVEKAGFDGVEVHCANGYLIDQFLQDSANQRIDEYGGSVENRSRFGLQVIDAVVKAVGEERTALRVSPWNTFQGMRMPDPIPQFSHFISSVVNSHPNLAYLHGVETPYRERTEESNDFLRKIWKPRPYVACGQYNVDTAIKRANNNGDLIAFGKWFISNPDLPNRIFNGIPLAPYDPKTFYGLRGHLKGTEIGYIDYPTADERQGMDKSL